MYSSRATELGRGVKVNKFTDAPDDTPAPNAYSLTTDFVSQQAANALNPPPYKTNLDGSLKTAEEIAQSPHRDIPWNQKGFE